MPRKRQRRADVVAFAGVVVDDVEDDLDAGIVQPLHRRLELAEMTPFDEKRGSGAKKPMRVVAPVIA